MTERESVQVRVSHRFAASAERVFDAWLDPAKVCRFLFATPEGLMVRTEIDARVGGRFTIVDRRAGEDVEHTGTYLEIERPRRLVFTLRVPKYSSEEDTVRIEVTPLAAGCELVLTHEMGASQAHIGGRVREGWQGILEVLEQLLPPAEPSCGEGLAQHSSIPARIAPMFDALAETLELHRALLDTTDASAREEDEAYRQLAASYRDLATRTASTARFMAECRGLAPCPHDTAAFGPAHLQAFERFVNAQNQLLEILRPAAQQDTEMLASMSRSE